MGCALLQPAEMAKYAAWAHALKPVLRICGPALNDALKEYDMGDANRCVGVGVGGVGVYGSVTLR